MSVDVLLEDWLALRYPGTRWVARPGKRRADMTPRVATARQILEPESARGDEQHPVEDREAS